MALEASSLAAKSCTPCRGGIPPLTAEDVATHQRQMPEWSVQEEARRIERTFKFKNFAEAFAFVQQAADLAEARGPSPGHQLRLGLRDGLATNEEDQGLARERFHHGGEVGSYGGRMSPPR